MALNPLIEKTGLQIRRGEYAVATATALVDPRILPMVQDYRRQLGGRLLPLDRDDINRKFPTADYLVSRKIDGEFTVLYFDGENLFTINPGGTIRVGLPLHHEAASRLDHAGIGQIALAGELYADVAVDRRPRVHDVVSVARQPGSDDDLYRLRLAVFDIVEQDGQSNQASFHDTQQIIRNLLGNGTHVHPVETVTAGSAAEIDKWFGQWVEGQGAEGLVVRSDSAGMFKIKPRHTLDVVVIGFTESTAERSGMLHDLLVSIVRSDGTLHVLTRVGGGFSDDQRRELLSDLKDMVVDSEYAEVNSDHVAYQMVRPDWVIEISCLDLISQTTRGGPVNRMVLQFNPSTMRYEVIRRLPLASVISPQFLRIRDDKSVNPFDVRIEQIADIVPVPMVDRVATEMTFAKSRLIRREVYTKVLKGETMVRKFLMWQTNKENDSEDYPGYVLHYTDFSPNRQTPLSREVRVSNSLQQIESLWLEFKESYIKQGWSKTGKQ